MESDHTSRVQRVATFFRQRPNQWIDGRELATIGGVYAWRSRASECRRPPHSMNIVNRQRHVRTSAGAFIVSEYKFIPEPERTILSVVGSLPFLE